MNDFVLNMNANEVGSHVFIIYYKKELNKFFIRSYRDKFIKSPNFLLIKIEESFPITRQETMMIADLFFQIKVGQDKIIITKMPCKKSPEERY